MKGTKHIILTDDDVAIQDTVRLMLEHKGYRITTFSDGSPLMDGTFEEADMFIIDKQLPGVDGLDICRYLKSQDQTKHLPVLILSASPQISRLAKEACADAFLEKPFKMQELREQVAKLLEA